eukprot:gene42194-51529_t
MAVPIKFKVEKAPAVEESKVVEGAPAVAESKGDVDEAPAVAESKGGVEEAPAEDARNVNTLQEWIALYKLDDSPAIMDLLNLGIGVEGFDELLFNDLELLELARKSLTNLGDLELYLNAGKGAKAFNAFSTFEAQTWLENVEAELREAVRRESLALAVRARQNQIQEQMIRVRKDTTVDIAFVLDLTGSIKSEMKKIRKGIMSYVSQLQALHGMARVRLAFVGFKDYGCKGERIVVLDFTENFEAFTAFMDKVQCGGGMDDGAEDVLGGLKAASELSWDAAHRFMYLVADNPCHGFIYHHDFVSGHEK